MTKRELSKYDFEAIDNIFGAALSEMWGAEYIRTAELRDLFAKAHTGWLEIEED